MAHENSISVRLGHGFRNLDTIKDGRQLTNEEAIKRARTRGDNILPGKFSTMEEAVRAAKERSTSFRKKPPRE